MKIIAHRGLMMGPNPEHENQPDTIDEAISHGFDVEVDVWNVSGRLMLGHDKPQYDTEHWMFNTDKIWWHAKNVEAIRPMIERKCRVFYHTNEDVVMTSRQELWALPGKGFSGSYIVLPENSKELIPDGALGICTDYALLYKEKYS